VSSRLVAILAFTPAWWASVASAQPNFPPVARASATPLEALVGETVSFDASASLDPDDGPSPLSYAWDFGDSATSTEVSPSHAYTAPGFYSVSLTVSDGAASRVDVLEIAVLAPPTPTAPVHSDTVTLTPDGSELWVVSPDSNGVTVVETSSFTTQEIEVCARPTTLVPSVDGGRIFVACRDDAAVGVLDAASRTMTSQLAVGTSPWGVVVVPDDGRVLASDEAEGVLYVLDPTASTTMATVDLGGTPRAIAVSHDGAHAYVTDFLTRGDAGRVSVVDLATLEDETVELSVDPGPDTASSGIGYPNLLGAVAIDPSGRRVWVGGLKSNTDRGQYLSGELLVPRNRLRGLLAPIDVTTRTEIVEHRIDTNDADSVTGIAFSPRGRFAYLLHQGAGRMSIYDLSAAELLSLGDGDTVPFESRVDVGHAPQGVAISPDGTRAYVYSFLSREVVVLDVTDPEAPSEVTRVRVVETEPLAANILDGKRMFFRSREPIHSDQNYIACASCHPDGGHDGRTWDFTQFGEGLRNTIDLRGRAAMAHGPVHWSANFDEIQDFENDIVDGFGGTGLADDGMGPHPPLGPTPNAGRSEALDDLAAYVATFSRYPPSPYREADGSLSDAALRGRGLFFDDTVGCFTCHAPPRFTDSTLTPDPADFVRYDVGTFGDGSGQRLGGVLDGLDTPTVLGVWVSPPYLHDGSAATLLEVVSDRNAGDAHGTTSHLSAGELDDLVAYLLSLDGSPDEIEPGFGVTDAGMPDGGGADGGDAAAPDGGTDAGTPDDGDGGCGCRVAAQEPDLGTWIVVAAVGAFFVRRRRRTTR
jgi:MYXO-CTERM domain-containing protein